MSFRRTQLSLAYATKISLFPTNPAYDCVFHAQHENLYAHHQRFIPSFGVCTMPLFESAEIPATYILPQILSHVPPWTIKIPTILYTLHNKSKSTTHSLTFQSLFAEMRHTYRDHQPIYTDGSKDQTEVSAVMYAPHSLIPPDYQIIHQYSLQNSYALILALRRIDTHKCSKFIVLTDFLSSLQSLSYFNITYPLVLQLLQIST
ncbi:hypothetical protein, partial [Solemya velum gill symbiont]|uniref:hypothetical protein n=1 Tax=Solemya velum gill symbiont TaxID=2340 RepID=UPI001C4DFC2A